MLAAPPAAAMMYVNDLIGLVPSEYGGGGSPSSGAFPDGPPFLSLEKAAFVSATTDDGGDGSRDSSEGGAGVKAGSEAELDSVTVALMQLSSDSGVE